MYKKSEKRGQITIFIIIAILVVAVVALIFAVSPKLRSSIGAGGAESPENFIQTCLEDSIKEKVDSLSLQGGSLDPEFFYLYQGNELQYLCYSNEYYKLCNVQIPFLRTSIETELGENIEEDVDFCFDSLKKRFGGEISKGEIKVELLPERILTTIDNRFTFTRAGETETRESFRVVLNNNLYELSAIAQNIIEWEAIYGGADPDIYMDIYRNLKVEKYEQFDETTIYIITDKEKDEKFQFASRSLAFFASGLFFHQISR